MEWTDQFEQVKVFEWVTLQEPLKWESVESTMKFMAERNAFDMENDASALLDQFNFVRNFASDEKIAEWKENKTNSSGRWVETFQHFDKKSIPFDKILLPVSFAFCLPGSSSPVERIFSHTNQIWDSNKSQLMPDTLEAILQVKVNIQTECTDFYKRLLSDHEALKKIHSNEKYIKS